MVITMTSNSLWEDTKISISNKKIKDKSTDILIIGAGITGLTLAYFLSCLSDQIMIIDKSQIGCGATSKTTAKINYLQGIIYQTLANKHDKNIAKSYLDSQLEAIGIIKEIIEKEQIACDLTMVDSIIFTCEEKNIKNH